MTEAVGPNPTDRGKPETKHHLVTERWGIPLVSLQTAANVNDGTVLLTAIAEAYLAGLAADPTRVRRLCGWSWLIDSLDRLPTAASP